MSIIKEYINEGTRIRIHDDYIHSIDKSTIKEFLINIIMNNNSTKIFSTIDKNVP